MTPQWLISTLTCRKTTHLTPLRLAALDMKTAAYFDEGAGRIIQPEQLK